MELQNQKSYHATFYSNNMNVLILPCGRCRLHTLDQMYAIIPKINEITQQ
jgi:hypothetical protein